MNGASGPTTRNQGLRRRSVGPYNMRNPGGAPRYGVAEDPNYWNESSRPAFAFDAPQFANLAGVPIDATTGVIRYQCVDCLNFFPKRSDAHGGPHITIDHKIPWHVFIFDNAAPDGEGKITRQAAKNAYNDLRNLQMMCDSCNSSKNGYSLSALD